MGWRWREGSGGWQFWRPGEAQPLQAGWRLRLAVTGGWSLPRPWRLAALAGTQALREEASPPVLYCILASPPVLYCAVLYSGLTPASLQFPALPCPTLYFPQVQLVAEAGTVLPVPRRVQDPVTSVPSHPASSALQRADSSTEAGR